MSDSQPAIAVIKTAAANSGANYLAQMIDGPNSSSALAAIGHSILGDDNATIEDIAAAVHEDRADLSLCLLQAEQQFLRRLSQADAALSAFPVGGVMTQQDLDNTLDARKRQIALHDKTNQRLAYIVSGAFFLLIFALLAVPHNYIDGTTKDLLFTLLGVVATGWANIIGYYFGSSAGSQQKSFAINAALTQSIQQSTS